MKVAQLLRGAEVQLRVIHAVALRETRTRFGQHRAGYLWAILEPLLWIGTFSAVFEIGQRGTPRGMGLVPFLATGILGYEIAIKTADRVSMSVRGNRALLFYPHVQPLDLVIARAALEIATYIVVFLLIVGGYGLVQGEAWIVDDPLTVVYGFLLAGMLGTTLGLLLCALMVSYPVVERIKGPFFRPLFWISGLFFSAESLPSNIREIFLYNPILHCIELVRDGFFPSYRARHADPGYVLVWIVALAFAGLTLERRVRSKVQLS